MPPQDAQNKKKQSHYTWQRFYVFFLISWVFVFGPLLGNVFLNILNPSPQFSLLMMQGMGLYVWVLVLLFLISDLLKNSLRLVFFTKEGAIRKITLFIFLIIPILLTIEEIFDFRNLLR